jgi:hypothetical protein
VGTRDAETASVIPSPPTPRRPQLPWLTPLLPLLALTLSACGGSTSSISGDDSGTGGRGTVEGGVSASQAAGDAANACAGIYVTDAFGDLATCRRA